MHWEFLLQEAHKCVHVHTHIHVLDTNTHIILCKLATISIVFPFLAGSMTEVNIDESVYTIKRVFNPQLTVHARIEVRDIWCL